MVVLESICVSVHVAFPYMQSGFWQFSYKDFLGIQGPLLFKSQNSILGCGFEIKCVGIFNRTLWSICHANFVLKKRPPSYGVFDKKFAKNGLPTMVFLNGWRGFLPGGGGGVLCLKNPSLAEKPHPRWKTSPRQNQKYKIQMQILKSLVHKHSI